MNEPNQDTAPVGHRSGGTFLNTTLELRIRYPSGRTQVAPFSRTPLRLGPPQQEVEVALEHGGPLIELRIEKGKVRYQSAPGEPVLQSGQWQEAGEWAAGSWLEVAGHRLLLWDKACPATFLQSYSQPYAGDLWPLQAGVHTMGRPGRRENSIQLDHPTVSREHATLTLSEGKVSVLAEYGNPVFVEGEEIQPGATALLEHGGLLELGDLMFKLHNNQPPSPPGLTVRSMGSFQVEVANQPVTEWGSKNARWLLARLAYAWGQPVPTDVIIDMLWPDLPIEKGRNNLGFTLSVLRKALRDMTPKESDGHFISRSSTSLQLTANLLAHHDVVQLKSELDRCARARRSGDDVVLDHSLETILDLYRGPFLQECYLDWADSLRETLELQTLEAGRELVERSYQQDRHDQVLRVAGRVLELDPCCQRTTSYLMRLHLLRKDAASALRAFDRCKQALRTQLDVAPDQDLLLEYQRALSTPIA